MRHYTVRVQSRDASGRVIAQGPWDVWADSPEDAAADAIEHERMTFGRPRLDVRVLDIIELETLED